MKQVEDIIDHFKSMTLEELCENDKVYIRGYLKGQTIFNNIDSYSMTYTEPSFELELVKKGEIFNFIIDEDFFLTEKE